MDEFQRGLLNGSIASLAIWLIVLTIVWHWGWI
jgi:hypothetical protein